MPSLDRTRLQRFPSKPRVFILSDISNEPDDAESLVRYLLYSNQFDTEGLVAVTSNWMKTKTCPQDMHKIVDAYAGAVDSLNQHTHPDHPYPSAEYLKGLIRSGPAVYGFQALAADQPFSPGADLLLSRILSPDPGPLWILVWGGTNCLAQALTRLSSTHSPSEALALRSKLRIYTISDQDDTAAFLRQTYPDLFYISSVHGWNQYGLAAWTGISGERFYGFDRGGPDFSKMSKEWIKEHIQIGPLGRAYPDYMFIPEGDTPTFLYLIQNGLSEGERPEWGSWGGRYDLVDRRMGGGRHYADAVDSVVGKDGKKHTSNQATIWRWRDAFQNDFAARMRWTMGGEKGNHHPVVCLNGSIGTGIVHVEAEAGTTVRLDASGTYDPDDDKLTFKWWHYKEPSASQWWIDAEVADLQIKPVDEEGVGRVVEVTLPPPEKCAVELMSRKPVEKGQCLHLVLEVRDDGVPCLTSYRRVVVQVVNRELRGGGEGAEAVGDLMVAFE